MEDGKEKMNTTMIIKTTNHYLTGADLINALQLPGRNYIELDGIRLVVEDGSVQGWYNPNGPELIETETVVPSGTSEVAA